jgi:hypothetical protein
LDLYVISRYGAVRATFREISTAAIEITSKIINDNVPKYKGK